MRPSGLLERRHAGMRTDSDNARGEFDLEKVLGSFALVAFALYFSVPRNITTERVGQSSHGDGESKP